MNIKFKRLTPFKRCVLQNFPFIEADFDALTNYGLLCKVVEYLNKVIKSQDEVQVVTEQMVTAFNNLYDYVNNYFDNLDVQDEINNKLDEMTESGELSDLIAQYIGLGALVTFNTLSEMIDSVNLSDGTKCKTLGKNTKGDGFGAYYTVGETGDILLNNGLYATLVPNFGGNNYYSDDDITTVVERHYNTTCYITTIPYNDSNNEMIKPYIAECPKGPLAYSQENETSFTMNATLGYHTLIHDGEVLKNRDYGNSSLPDSAEYLGITADRTLIGFKANTATYQNMINAGAKEAFLVFYKIINNGVKPDWDEIDTEWTSDGENIATSHHPRQCIGIKEDKTLIILTTDGRRPTEKGLTSDRCADILLELGCINAWNLDGGGSTSSCAKGYKLNANIDDSYTKDRTIEACLNFKKTTIDEELGKVNSYIGKTINENNKKLVELINTGIVKTFGNASLNNLINTQQLTYGSFLQDSPATAGWVETIPISENNMLGKWAKQVLFERDKSRIFTRSLLNEEFKPWKPAEGFKSELYDRGANYFSLTSTAAYEKYQFENATFINNVTHLNFMTVDTTNNVIKFAADCATKVKLLIYFDLQHTADTGGRYVQVKAGNTVIQAASKQWQYNTASVETNTCSTLCVVDATKDISIEFYGHAGDKIRRMTIIAEQFE